LKSFIFWKYDVVKKLNGIFSFAIWNSKKNELFLARDHFGVKPLFYTIYNNTLVFASEIKALFKYPGIEAKLDDKVLLNFLELVRHELLVLVYLKTFMKLNLLILEYLMKMVYILKDIGSLKVKFILITLEKLVIMCVFYLKTV
jgi:asparagine synthase (glutamine-hydrolysing)